MVDKDVSQGRNWAPIRERVKRRGVLAVVAALVAGGAAQLGRPKAAEATNGQPLVVGANNTSTSTTALSMSVSGVALLASSPSGTGGAIRGENAGGVGVFGASNSTSGVVGFSAGGAGVYGTSSASYGTQGVSANSFGVGGISNSSYGVAGTSAGSMGVAGFSSSAHGLYGESNSGFGIYATSRSGVAGQFVGQVIVQGDFSATGMKSAVVPHPDGIHRRVYCLESPESYFEDFGEKAIEPGKTIQVDLDDDFSAIVETSQYQVFLTEYGVQRGLYVVSRGPKGFTVGAKDSTAPRGTFGYRVVAKRKDIVAPRLEHVKLPEKVKNRPEPPRNGLTLRPEDLSVGGGRP